MLDHSFDFIVGLGDFVGGECGGKPCHACPLHWTLCDCAVLALVQFSLLFQMFSVVPAVLTHRNPHNVLVISKKVKHK